MKNDTAFPVTQDIPVNPNEPNLGSGSSCQQPLPLLEGGTQQLWLVPWLETVPDGLTDWLTWTLIRLSGTGRAVENAAPAMIGNALPAIRHRDQGASIDVSGATAVASSDSTARRMCKSYEPCCGIL